LILLGYLLGSQHYQEELVGSIIQEILLTIDLNQPIAQGRRRDSGNRRVVALHPPKWIDASLQPWTLTLGSL
jgi:Flp pilus assembly CpaF family ATPase